MRCPLRYKPPHAGRYNGISRFPRILRRGGEILLTSRWNRSAKAETEAQKAGIVERKPEPKNEKLEAKNKKWQNLQPHPPVRAF
jgi:hypothetical protein